MFVNKNLFMLHKRKKLEVFKKRSYSNSIKSTSCFNRNIGWIKRIEISPLMKSKLLSELKHIPINPYQDYSSHFQVVCSVPFQDMGLQDSKEIKQAIMQFRKNEIQCIFFKQLPLSEFKLPHSPIFGDRLLSDKDFISEKILLGLSGLFKTNTYKCLEEKDGSVIQQVCAKKGSEYEVSSRGTAVDFGFHIENAHEVSPPDIFFLFCLKGDKNAETILMPIDDIICQLTQDEIKGLQKKDFILRTGPSFNTVIKSRAAILEYDQWGFKVQYNGSKDSFGPRTTGIDRDSEKLLSKFEHILKNTMVQSVCLQSCDLLIFNNRRVMHGRKAYIPSNPQGEERWLQRMYCKDSI